MPWYVYLVKCSDDTLYCNVCRRNKVLERFAYLQSRSPYTVLKKRKFTRLSDAVIKCIQIRKLKKSDKLKGLDK